MLNFILHIISTQHLDNFILRIISIQLFFPEINHYSKSYTHAEFQLGYSAAGPIEIRIFRMTFFSSQLLKEHYFEKSEGEIFDLKPNRNNFLYCTIMTKKILNIQKIRGMTSELTYIGNFKFLFKNILGCESGATRERFMKKNRG
jgi:hypothetical protein